MTAPSAPTTRRILPMAVILTGLGLAAACNATTASPLATADAPVTCAISVEETGRMVNFQGQLRAQAPATGTYSLSLAGRGTNIRQGGPFSASAGEVITLGQSRLSGTASAYDIDLTVTVNGTSYRCPVSEIAL